MISLNNFTHTTNVSTPLHRQFTYTTENGYQNSEMFVYEFENSSFEEANFSNSSFESNGNYSEYAEIPYYIKATSMTFCIVIMCLGVIGNVMVPIVILKTKDMRNSTNIFLVNLSIADLMVLLVCTPTVLVEVNSKPETWVLGKELCLAVPFVELTVTHASVLTILAISFERYYAICEPLRAGYVCTKTRAALICALVWFFAALFTSPILAIAEHHIVKEDGAEFAQCFTQAVTFWQITFFVAIIIILYTLPLIILIILYSIIAKNLINAASKVVMNKTVDPYNTRARKQVILMLGTVVLCFFLCLMPYRVLTLWIIVAPSDLPNELSPEKWYNILYFSRVMLYINSAINPILYNLMSSKFRIGFCKVFICICYRRKKDIKSQRVKRTVTNGSTTSSSLSRTTNSLKKLFSHRGSVDKSDTESEGKDGETSNVDSRGFFDKIFSKRTFVRQQSAPVCSTTKPIKVNRMRSEGNMETTVDIEHKRSERFIGQSDIKNRSDVELDLTRTHSLRRSVLINSAKAKSVDQGTKKAVSYQKIKVDCVVGFQKSKSVDYEFPESFV
ncbi:thyrotropin-releasing hormone receptor-like isoform X1 [Ostrinia furnacalis]|uniref:thyrotropin-releasing hormone receptor-like isoform X1 n=1 Tax=Ostrinia furnacalis TaxID=93504 RepID=UPI001038D71C|nr:thyrotropin-releasing hormone receptor-like isoform X1 [Ostrinia furnacalis]